MFPSIVTGGQPQAERYLDWKTVVEVPVSAPRDYVKMRNALCRLTIPDLHLACAALEAQRPPVSEGLAASELEVLIDRNARWVPPRARTPSPVPRYGRGEGGRRIRNPSLIRRIRADRLNREKADELASRKEAIASMEKHGKRARPPATGDGQPITPRQVVHLDASQHQPAVGELDVPGVAETLDASGGGGGDPWWWWWWWWWW